MASIACVSRSTRHCCKQGDNTLTRSKYLWLNKGEGIAPENLTCIFAHGFTTRKEGHGFGLHSCVLAAQAMGGTLIAHSAGAGTGATFTLELPITPCEEMHEYL